MATTYPIPGFPTTHLAEDGQRLTIRPMTPDDQAALRAFFETLPASDRYYLKDDVTAPEIVQAWASDPDYSRVVPLLATDGHRIVALGTLHQRRAAARRHVGEVRVTVDPAYRDKGIGRGLLHKLAEVARDRDLERLLFEIVADVEQPARHAAVMLGFVSSATLRGHVRDAGGGYHDLLMMELDLQQEFPPLPDKF